jgi:tetratricopeptide (TPR) repeat protein
VHLVDDLAPAPQTARVLAGYAQVLTLRGRPAAGRARCERAIELAREVGARAEEGQALNTLGVCIAALGDPDRGVETIREAKRIADELPWVEARGRAYVNLSVAVERAGRLRESVEVALEGMQAMSGLGAPLGTIFLGNDAARRMVRLGLATDAQRILTEVDELGPFGVSQAAHQTAQSELAILEGRAADALAAATKAVNSFGDSRDSIYFGPALAAEIGALLAAGRGEEAASVFRSSIGLITGEPDAFSLANAYARGIRACADSADDYARAAQAEFAALLDASRYPEGSAPPRALAYATAIDAEIARLDGKDDVGLWTGVAEIWAKLDEEAERAYALSYARS